MTKILNHIIIAVSTLVLAGCVGKGESARIEMSEAQPIQYAEQITIDKLPDVLQRLQEGKWNMAFSVYVQAPLPAYTSCRRMANYISTMKR